MVGQPDIHSGRWAHAVQLYDADHDLTRSVGEYLAAGLRAGETAIVVATATHARSFGAALDAAGVDVDDMTHQERLVVIDADGARAQIMDGERPDAAAFASVLGDPIRRSVATTAVRVYGEVVDLLWQDNLVVAAMELEGMWNELGRQLPFSLFCAYHVKATPGARDHPAITDVCHAHSEIIGAGAPRLSPLADPGPPEREVAQLFARANDAPRAARQFVTEALRGWGHDDLIDPAALVVTELATNAVLHAWSNFLVTVACRPDSAVHISVTDWGPALPLPDDPPPTATSGRGLRLVETASTRWGTELTGDGKVVWAELHS